MVEKETKYVTKEYHEGAMAYERGAALTSNPYLSDPDGGMWYWMFGWQDAMAADVRSIKQTILAAATTHKPENGRLN
jgi:hypothetical protein|tara:strand:- start:1497 stop:1727 length:231 start_codon:yes stop_codon:yes gene_type:complete